MATKTTFPVPGRTLPDGPTLIPAQNIPVGCTGAILTLDVSGISKTAGQLLLFNIEYNDTVNPWTGFSVGFDGPWLDKQGVLHNESALSIGFGSLPDGNGQLVPRAAAAGWQIRATVTAVNGPITTAGGSLVVQ